ncbi:MAG: S41 family peptidase [Clostridia bacterium]
MEEKNMKRQNVYKVIMLVVLTAVITFMLTTIVMYNKFYEVYEGEYSGTSNGINLGFNSSSNSNEASLVKTLENFKAMLKQKYIGEIDEEKLIEGAIKGYVEGLGDPYTEYLTKEEMQEFTEETNAEYVGIGVYVANNTVDNTILVAGVMKNSPALEAGMQAGDIITKVDGVPYTGEELSDATKVLKGQEGTTVKVTILRDGKESELTVTRKKITVEHVASKMLENNIAYIQIDSFDSGVVEAFKEQITTLKNDGAKGIIIDLRSNGGGIVDEATGVADLFLEKNETILITKSKNEEEQITKSKNAPIITDIPVVILVNEGTASASEILAGALKDKYGATIVGKTTYGKGVIQTLYSLTDGSGLKITTDEYYTPNHNKINKVGITPDVEVSLTKDANGYYETSMDKDAQLLKAIEILKK